MKTIVLVRHAKALKSDKMKDFERPLRKRGMKDASIMGKVLKNLNVIPDYIISSPAVRTMTTAQLIAKELSLDNSLVVSEPHLYLESKAKILMTINRFDDKSNTIYIVGHNPDLTDLANLFLPDAVKNIPTGGVFGLQFENATWAELAAGNGKMLFFEIPKKHRKDFKKGEEQLL